MCEGAVHINNKLKTVEKTHMATFTFLYLLLLITGKKKQINNLHKIQISALEIYLTFPVHRYQRVQ